MKHVYITNFRQLCAFTCGQDGNISQGLHCTLVVYILSCMVSASSLLLCCRLLGLTQFLDVDCASDNVVGVKLDLPWMEYVYVLVVIFFYFILAWELRRCRRKVFVLSFLD